MIPDELRAIDRWLAWRPVAKDGGGFDKVPFAPAKDWSHTRLSYAAAEAARRRVANAGLGFVFAATDNIGGIDLDCCRDPASGTITDWAREILDAFGTYAEVSPSGTGVKLLAHGCHATGRQSVAMPGEAAGGHARPAIEVFASTGFFASTGDRLPNAPRQLTSADAAQSGWAMIRELLGPPRKHEAATDGADWNMIDAEALAHLLAGLDVTHYRDHEEWFGLMCARTASRAAIRKREMSSSAGLLTTPIMPATVARSGALAHPEQQAGLRRGDPDPPPEK